MDVIIRLTVFHQCSDKFTTRTHSRPTVRRCATPTNNTSVKEEILIILYGCDMQKAKREQHYRYPSVKLSSLLNNPLRLIPLTNVLCQIKKYKKNIMSE